MKESDKEECLRVQQGQVQGQAIERDAQLADPAAWGEGGKVQDQGELRKCDEASKHDERSKNNPMSEEE